MAHRVTGSSKKSLNVELTKTASGRAGPVSAFDSTRAAAEFLASLPCVVYEATADLTVKMISANTADLFGIPWQALCGNRSLWEDRIPKEDRERLIGCLAELKSFEIAWEKHGVIGDQGARVGVLHGIRKIGNSSKVSIWGCLTPIELDPEAKSVNTSVVSQFIHKIGNHFQLVNLMIGSMRRNGAALDEIDQLQATVDRGVEFTRAFSHYNQTPAQFSAVDFVDIIESVVQATAPLFIEKNVICVPMIDDSLYGAPARGDRFLLELALGSVLHNAFDATRNPAQVIFEAKRVPASANHGSVAQIAVIDNGPGMAKETLARATEPFFTSRPDRDGLGLAIATRIARMHGGSLTISSREGRGTRVELLFPLDGTVQPCQPIKN